MEVVDTVEDRHVDLRELEAQEPPAGLQNAVGLAERLVDVRDVADAERDRIGVERAILEGQRLGVPLDEFDALRQALVVDAALPDLEHLRADVADHRPAARPAALDEA